MSSSRAYFRVALVVCLLAVVVLFIFTRQAKKNTNEFVKAEPENVLARPDDNAPVTFATFPKSLSEKEKRLLLGKFETVSDLTAFPSAIKGFYGIGNNSLTSGMVNPGEQFNAGDGITNDKLPGMRLVIAAGRPKENFWIVEYERGGRVRMTRVDFLTVSSGSVEPLWRCRLPAPITGITELLKSARDGTCQ